MIHAPLDETFESWRLFARECLVREIPPEDIFWCSKHELPPLFAESLSGAPLRNVPRISPNFLALAKTICAHTSPERWSILYRLLWRLTLGGEKNLLEVATDPDVRCAKMLAKAVGHEIHKMHSFLRFRLVSQDAESGREYFAGWFEPEFRIVRLATPFFVKRFFGMDWSIFTQQECAHWDGEHLYFTTGQDQNAVPPEDASEDLWRLYYRQIFNPARLNLEAMQSGMPKKYWKNLPEAEEIFRIIEKQRSS